MGWSPLDINKPRAKQYIGDEPYDAISECFAEVRARGFAIEDRCPMVGVYDSRGMSPLNIAEIVRQKLIVKVCPMHPETLELQEWLVIANARVTAADKRQPRGPNAISGDNRHLEMAEYYYRGRRVTRRLEFHRHLGTTVAR